MKKALDVDGVLANFYSAFCRKFNMPVETVMHWDRPWINDKFHEVENDHHFWANLPVLNGPEEISFEFDYYITSLPDNLKSAREEWLEKNGFPNKPVILSYDKSNTMLELGVELIIDDKHQTIIEVHDSGLTGIQFIPYYMQPADLHHLNVRNLHDVNDIVEKIKNSKL